MFQSRRRSRIIVFSCLFIFIVSFTPIRSRLDAHSQDAFPLAVDHVLVWVARGAPEAKSLEDAGLTIQSRTNQHTGQGTASRVFLFENLYLELIWIEDEEVAASNAIRAGFDMIDRAHWRQTGASPFGVGLHRTADSVAKIPFPVKPYWAEWMKPDTSIEFAKTVTNNSEPMFFVVPDYISTASPAMQTTLRERLGTSRHRLGITRLTSLRIVTTGKQITATSQVLTRGGIMKVERGQQPLLELTFDGGRKNQTLNLRPQLPIVLKY